MADGAGFYEFFAGGGMARLGLGPAWTCLFANDVCPKKGAAYRRNFGEDAPYVVEDVARLSSAQLPGRPDLVWASFPCQDLSRAGRGAGLRGARSGTFWPFWELMRALDREGRGAPVVVLENVVGALSSNRGADFRAIVAAVAASGRRVGALVLDAADFVPQSRPRLFVVAVAEDVAVPEALRGGAAGYGRTRAVAAAAAALPDELRASWIDWRLPAPDAPPPPLAALIEDVPRGVRWRPAAETARLLAMMSATQRAKLRAEQARGGRVVGALYRRTRRDAAGTRVQRAEARFDGVGGCLRTPAGGSSRQTILVVEGEKVRSRLLSAREAARMMGLPDGYVLPDNYNEAYHLVGDGVVVPVVDFLARRLLAPLRAARR